VRCDKKSYFLGNDRRARQQIGRAKVIKVARFVATAANTGLTDVGFQSVTLLQSFRRSLGHARYKLMHKMHEILLEPGLHGCLKNLQKAFLSSQCVQIEERLDALIEKTRAAIPGRKQNFYFNVPHGETLIPSYLEAKLERAIWRYAHNSQNVEGLGNACVRIHSYQVPLTVHGAPHLNRGWAEFDLMGTNNDGLPVVLELKTDASRSSNPLHMTLEAAKYGVALLQMWPHMLTEWKEAFNEDAPKAPLKTCQLIGIAPDKYWTYWFNSKRQARLWRPLKSLATKLAERGLPISFASFKYKLIDAGLPQVAELQRIDLPD
jgi:hypothetical protein